MNYIKLFITAIILVYYATGCSKQTQNQPQTCSLSKQGGVTIIDCGTGGSLPIYNGSPGEKGDTGAPGVAGTGCDIETVTGGVAITCNGTTQTVYDGNDGVDGAPGTDATPVTVKQLCAGTPSYPGTFIEDALCIGSKLYGVYSVPGAFLTYLPPGTYTSTGIGSSCNFTIDTDCGIVQN